MSNDYAAPGFAPAQTHAANDRYERACELDDLWQGEMLECKVGGQKVLLLHTEDGIVRAIQASCPHQSVPLVEGRLEGSTVICRMHLWCINGVTGKGINPKHADVACYPVRVADGTVYVKTDGIQPRYCKP
jgi:toluene monooxygenase system ferredoxin subunit